MIRKTFSEKIKKDFQPVTLPTQEMENAGEHETTNLDNARLIPISETIPDPNQSRKKIDQEKIKELADSIKSQGILEPITVRFNREKGKYIIVTGERRYRAAIIAGLKQIPCLIRELTDQQALICQLIENVQREDLSPIEESTSYKKLIDNGWTQTRISNDIGRSQTYISLMLKIPTLPKNILREAEQKNLPKEYFILLSKSQDPEKLWEEIKQGKKAKEIKAEAKKEKPSKGRPKNFSHTIQPEGKPYKVIVQFKKPHAENDEIREALRTALDSL
jgi:ParB family chromosome partitioning protein